MATGMTSSKRFVIRTSLITGSTIALIIGAETLMAVDVQTGRAVPNNSTTSNDELQDQTASTGIRVVRGGDVPIILFSGNDDASLNSDQLFNQQLQSQFAQQNPSFGAQQLFQRPRTHSSR